MINLAKFADSIWGKSGCGGRLHGKNPLYGSLSDWLEVKLLTEKCRDWWLALWFVWLCKLTPTSLRPAQTDRQRLTPSSSPPTSYSTGSLVFLTRIALLHSTVDSWWVLGLVSLHILLQPLVRCAWFVIQVVTRLGVFILSMSMSQVCHMLFNCSWQVTQKTLITPQLYLTIKNISDISDKFRSQSPPSGERDKRFAVNKKKPPIYGLVIASIDLLVFTP